MPLSLVRNGPYNGLRFGGLIDEEVVGCGDWVGWSLVATAHGQPQVRPLAEFVPGEVLIQYRRAATTVRRDAIVAARRARLVRRFDQLDIDHLQLASGEDLAAALAALRSQPDVAAVSPNYVRHAVATTPNDTRWSDRCGG